MYESLTDLAHFIFWWKQNYDVYDYLCALLTLIKVIDTYLILKYKNKAKISWVSASLCSSKKIIPWRTLQNQEVIEIQYMDIQISI